MTPKQKAQSVVICQVRSDSMFRINVTLGDGFVVQAVIDTAAEVTLVSDRVFEKIPGDIPVLEQVSVMTAGRELFMKGAIVGPIKIEIGGQSFTEKVYVAPIEDSMLLGLDFMRKHEIKIDIPRSTISIKDTIVSMNEEVASDSLKVAKIRVDKSMSIPPNSVALVPCSVETKLDTFVVEGEGVDLVVPMSVHAGERELRLAMLNLSDHSVKVKGPVDRAGKASEMAIIGRFRLLEQLAYDYDFCFMQKWLMHGTEPPDSECDLMVQCACTKWDGSDGVKRGRLQ